MKQSARRWLLHRRKQRLIGWTDRQQRCGYLPGWQSTYWQAIGETITDEMCKPDLPAPITQRITRILSRVDENEPTLAVPIHEYWFYASDTIADQYATQPMEPVLR